MNETVDAVASLVVAYLLAVFAIGLGKVAGPRSGSLSGVARLPRAIPRLAVASARWTLARLRQAVRARTAPGWGPRRGAGAWCAPLGWLVTAFSLPLRAYARVQGRNRVRFLASWLRRLEDEPCPRWVLAAAERLQLELARYGVRDAFQVRLSPSARGSDVLGWYPCFSQFEAGAPLLVVTPEFVPYVLRAYEAAGNDRRDLSARELTRSAVYLLAHEYGHVVVELARVLALSQGAAWVGVSEARARRLHALVEGWRDGERGRDEAFCDDLAAFLRGADPCFLEDDAMPLGR